MTYGIGIWTLDIFIMSLLSHNHLTKALCLVYYG